MIPSLREKVSEWYASEKKKLEGKSLREKIEYIAEYYWIQIVLVVGGLAFAIFAIYRANFAIKEYWLYGIFANTMENGGSNSPLWQDFEEYAGYDLKQKNLEFNASSWFDPTVPGGTNNSYYQAFVAVTEAGDLDFVTLGKEGLQAVGSSGRLLDLNSEACTKIREKYEDRFVYCLPYDEEYSTEEVPVGIDLSDSLLVTKYHIYEDNCVLGIGAYSHNLENVEQFLRFVLGDEAGDPAGKIAA